MTKIKNLNSLNYIFINCHFVFLFFSFLYTLYFSVEWFFDSLIVFSYFLECFLSFFGRSVSHNERKFKKHLTAPSIKSFVKKSWLISSPEKRIRTDLKRENEKEIKLMKNLKLRNQKKFYCLILEFGNEGSLAEIGDLREIENGFHITCLFCYYYITHVNLNKKTRDLETNFLFLVFLLRFTGIIEQPHVSLLKFTCIITECPFVTNLLIFFQCF